MLLRGSSRWAATIVLFGTLVLAVPAAAHDHRPSKIRLLAGGQQQEGNGYHVWWTSGSRYGCVSEEAFGPRTFPDALTVPPGTESVSLRFVKKQKPSELEIVAWRAVGPDGQPLGPQESIEFRLQPKKRDGRVVAWSARFAAPDLGHLYLQTFVTWRDREMCGGEQGGWWAHHIEVAPG